MSSRGQWRERSDSDALSVTQPPAPLGGSPLGSPAAPPAPGAPAQHPRSPPPSAATSDPLPKQAGCARSGGAAVHRLSLCPLAASLWPCPCWCGQLHRTASVTSLTFLRSERLRCLFPCCKEDPGILASLQVQMFVVSAQRARFSDICS